MKKYSNQLRLSMALAAAGGMNILPPQELKDVIKFELPEVSEDSIIYMKKAVKGLSQEEIAALIVNTAMDNLKLVPLMKLREAIGDIVLRVMDYGGNHPEVREESSVEDLNDIMEDD